MVFGIGSLEVSFSASGFNVLRFEIVDCQVEVRD